MEDDEDFLPISGLQHLVFCERQCALIHVERLWAENRLTAEGRVVHERAHDRGTDSRGDLRIVRALPLRSTRLRLTGFADVVEFHRDAGSGVETWRPFPVEYKRGRRQHREADQVQLCAQAFALEDMLGLEVPRGAIYYDDSRRRLEVVLDPSLRAVTERAAARFHEIVRTRTTPLAVFEPKCSQCSLRPLCLPEVTGAADAAREYMQSVLATGSTDVLP